MNAAIRDEDDYNLTDSTFFGRSDPEDILRRIRNEDPVHWTVGRYNRGFWSVTKHRDGRFVYENDKIFSSARSGPMLPISTDYENPVEGDLPRATTRRCADIRYGWAAACGDAACVLGTVHAA
ncbi:MAG: hypothetical protein WDM89_11765 [Rhizomicrobium sp.]